MFNRERTQTWFGACVFFSDLRRQLQFGYVTSVLICIHFKCIHVLRNLWVKAFTIYSTYERFSDRRVNLQYYVMIQVRVLCSVLWSLLRQCRRFLLGLAVFSQYPLFSSDAKDACLH